MPKISANDPYVYEGTNVLKNKFDIKNQDTLNKYETLFVFERRSLLPKVDLKSGDALKQIHQHLFQDVYEWAGAYRSVDISKGETFFARADFIENEINKTSKKLKFDHGDTRSFSKNAASVIADINAIHPFRDGNGRVMRAFLSLYARENNMEFNSRNINKDEWIRASIESFNGHEDNLQKIIEKSTKRLSKGKAR